MALIDAQRSETAASMAAPLIDEPLAATAADAAAQRPTNTPHEEITTGMAAHTLIDAEDAADDDAAADEFILTAPPVGTENRAWRYVAAGMFLSAGAVFTLVAVRGGEKSGGD